MLRYFRKRQFRIVIVIRQVTFRFRDHIRLHGIDLTHRIIHYPVNVIGDPHFHAADIFQTSYFFLIIISLAEDLR